MRASQRIIMGIDPGTNLLGFGVILVDANSVHLVDMGVVDLRKIKEAPTEMMIIAEGTSNTQVAAIADEVDDFVRTETHVHPLSASQAVFRRAEEAVRLVS